MQQLVSRGCLGVVVVLLSWSCGKDDAKSTGERDLTPHGLGQVCTSTSNCENHLTCRVDPSDTTANQLCTAACSAASDCQTQFAEYTTCTGVHVCVVTCETDDDCTAGTVCDAHGWCQRGGPDSGVQACVGTIAPCNTVTTQAACAAARCVWSGTCSGSATPCAQLTSAAACAAQSGCSWYARSSECAGVPMPCASNQVAGDCAAQAGCSWVDGCVGQSAIGSCEAAGLTFCSTTPGCQLVTQ